MQTYVVEYKHTPWSEHGGFKNISDYYDLERVVIRSQDIDRLRVKIINELAKGRPFRSYVYKIDKDGGPDYESSIGQLFYYPKGYYWFVRDTHNGWAVNPKTGKRMR